MLVFVVTGSLGAGKTTVVCSLVESLNDKEVSYIVNDAGAVAFDAVRVNIPSTERLLAGCVCCEDVASLTRTLHKISIAQPDSVVIVEPSGLADSAQIMSAMSLLGLPLEVVHLHVINAELDSLALLDEVQPTVFVLNRYANESEFELWKRNASYPVVSFNPGDKADSLTALEPMSALMLSRMAGSGHVHHGYFIKNLLVLPEKEQEFLYLLGGSASSGWLQRAKGRLSCGTVSATAAGVQISDEPLYDEVPQGVMLVIGDATLEGLFASFDVSDVQLDLLLKAYRNIDLMKKAPNLNDQGNLLVANDCDVAQLIIDQITDKSVAARLRKDVYREMVNWRLASVELLESCVGTREEKLFWEHSLAAKLGYIFGDVSS